MVGTYVTEDDIIDYITDTYGTVKIPKIGDVEVGDIINLLFDKMQEGWIVFEDEFYEHLYEMICDEIDKNGYSDFTKEHTVFDLHSTDIDSFNSNIKRYSYSVRFYYDDWGELIWEINQIQYTVLIEYLMLLINLRILIHNIELFC